MIRTTDVLVLPPRNYQLRHLAVIPLRIDLPSSPETGLTLCESDKQSLLSLVRMTLSRNNHCERGFRVVGSVPTLGMVRLGNFIDPNLPQYTQLQMSTNTVGKVPAVD